MKHSIMVDKERGLSKEIKWDKQGNVRYLCIIDKDEKIEVEWDSKGNRTLIKNK